MRCALLNNILQSSSPSNSIDKQESSIVGRIHSGDTDHSFLKHASEFWPLSNALLPNILFFPALFDGLPILAYSMPPDLNTVPRSPRAPENVNAPSAFAHAAAIPQQTPRSHSRRTSSAMGPPPVPQNSSLPNSPRHSNVFTDNNNTGVGLGPGKTMVKACKRSRSYIVIGPIRHPRPLTAAELHLELEKEQEGIVSHADLSKGITLIWI